MACAALQYFSTLSHKQHEFLKTATEHKMCVLIFYTAFVLSISNSKKNNRARYDKKLKSVFMYSARYSCKILMKLEFSRQIFEKKKSEISNCIRICPVGAELFHADGQTYMTKLTVACRNFAKVCLQNITSGGVAFHALYLLSIISSTQ